MITKVELHPSDDEINDDDEIDILKHDLKKVFDNYLVNIRKEREQELNLG